MEEKTKIITILGVTASGKTGMSLELAKKFNGEIISADSRQIYKEFDIGTAKPRGHWTLVGGKKEFVSAGIVHHLVDVIDPKEDFRLHQYQNLAVEKIKEAAGRGKTPFLVGGTALYLKAILENWSLPPAEPNHSLRAKFERKSAEELFKLLKKEDPEAALITGEHNKRRMIRALEVIKTTGKKFSEQRKKEKPVFEALKLGVAIGHESLVLKINERTRDMMKNGLAEEVRRLHKKYSWNLPPMQSIGYLEFKEYFENKKTAEETEREIIKNSLDYARRQMTWFKKDKEINWVGSETEAQTLVKKFLS